MESGFRFTVLLELAHSLLLKRRGDCTEWFFAKREGEKNIEVEERVPGDQELSTDESAIQVRKRVPETAPCFPKLLGSAWVDAPCGHLEPAHFRPHERMRSAGTLGTKSLE